MVESYLLYHGINWRHLKSKYGMEICNFMKSWDEKCNNECEICESMWTDKRNVQLEGYVWYDFYDDDECITTIEIICTC